MAALRADAARSRARILEAARAHEAGALRLNEVAHEAGVGVGTVYRHFPTIHALVEALATTALEAMLETSRRAAALADPADALALCTRSMLTLQLEHPGLQAVLLAPEDEAAEVHEAKREIFDTFASVLERARSAGVVRADVTLGQLAHLVCGIEHAVRLGSPDDRAPLLDVLLSGLRPPAT